MDTRLSDLKKTHNLMTTKSRDKKIKRKHSAVNDFPKWSHLLNRVPQL